MRIKCTVVKGYSGKKPGDIVYLNHVEAKGLVATGFVKREEIEKTGSYQTRDMAAESPKTVNVSDSVAEYAKENGVDVAALRGTGKDGRILKSDVREFIESKG